MENGVELRNQKASLTTYLLAYSTLNSFGISFCFLCSSSALFLLGKKEKEGIQESDVVWEMRLKHTYLCFHSLSEHIKTFTGVLVAWAFFAASSLALADFCALPPP
jgi:hypothetical protein